MAFRIKRPLLAVGLASVVYWHVTEVRGCGDLRYNALVQNLPMALLPLAMLLYNYRLIPGGYVWG